MKDLSASNFGLLIAYVVPGLVALWGLSFVFPFVSVWLRTSPEGQPTVAGFLYVSLASIGTGLFVSTLRWMSIDPIQRLTRVVPPAWDFAKLQDNLDAFELLNESHYRYYQFHANTLVAAVIAFVLWSVRARKAQLGTIDLVFCAAIGVLFVGARHTLKNYYSRVGVLLR